MTNTGVFYGYYIAMLQQNRKYSHGRIIVAVVADAGFVADVGMPAVRDSTFPR